METISAMPMAGGMSPADVKALMSDNNGFGNGNGLTWILLLLLFGQGGFGNNANNTQDTVLRAIDGSDADIRYLGQILNSDITAIKSSLCGIKEGIATQTGTIVSSSKDVINAMQLGQCTLSKEFADCCCQTQRSIDTVRLDMSQQTNSIDKSICDLGFQNQMGFTNLGNIFRESLTTVSNQLTNGFNQTAFAIQAQTNQLETVMQAEGRATRELIRDREFAALEKENSEYRLQASQAAQTAAILAACGCCPNSNSGPGNSSNN